MIVEKFGEGVVTVRAEVVKLGQSQMWLHSQKCKNMITKNYYMFKNLPSWIFCDLRVYFLE